jgi:hypothetical protein
MEKTVSVMNNVEFTHLNTTPPPCIPQVIVPGHETRQRIEKLTSYAASEFVKVNKVFG